MSAIVLERAEALRGMLGITRSRLFELAVEEVARRYENRMLLDRMNAAYGDGESAGRAAGEAAA